MAEQASGGSQSNVKGKGHVIKVLRGSKVLKEGYQPKVQAGITLIKSGAPPKGGSGAKPAPKPTRKGKATKS